MVFKVSRLLIFVALLPLVGATPAWADSVITAKRIDLPGVSLQQVRMQLTQGATPDSVQVGIHASRVDIPRFGWHKVGFTLQGTLQRDVQLRWVFTGATQLLGTPGGALSKAALALTVDPSTNTLEIEADQGVTHIGTAFPLDQPTHAQINLRNLPAGWLQGLLASVWPGHISAGKLDADLALDVRDQGFQSSGDFTVADLQYTTPAGDVGGQGLAGHMRFALDATAFPAELMLNGGLRGGQLRLGPVLAQLPQHGVFMDLHASTERGGLSIGHLRFDDADALHAEGALALDAKGRLQKLRLDHFRARFPAAYERYGQPWLDDMAASPLHLTGQLEGHLDYAAGRWRSFAFHTNGLDVADSAGEWQAAGLHGDMDWSEKNERPATTLAWSALALYRLRLGAGQSRWRSRDGALVLQSPVDVALLKGQAHIARLNWRPAAAQPERFDIAMDLHSLDMAAFDQAMGWTPIAGTMNGAISSVQWTGDRYALNGELSINAFNGTLAVNHLSVQQPWSAGVVWGGDISLHQIDLAALTDAFNFGSMTGKLEGTIDGLRLSRNGPIAFKASLLTQNDGRISLRAANNLSVVTGGTAASGLQGAVMRLFKTFGYKRMGIQAELQNGVCTLGGLDGGSSSGYSIVEGSGLPYVHVVGTQTKVDWPILVHRLKAASQGTVAER